jgi:hypothetical protein
MTDAASSRTRSSSRRKRETTSTRRTKPLAAEKLEEARRVAANLHRKRPDWITFHRVLFGVGGEIVRLFPSAAERDAFEQTDVYAAIEAMEEDLRRHRIRQDDPEPTRIITVRLPRSVHEALRDEAISRKLSINKLCIAKLITAIEASPEK